MNSADTVEGVFREAFEDVALLIGTVAVVHSLEDGVVRTLLRRLDRVRLRTFARLPQAHGPRPAVKAVSRPRPLHPAVQEFLSRNNSQPAEVPDADGSKTATSALRVTESRRSAH